MNLSDRPHYYCLHCMERLGDYDGMLAPVFATKISVRIHLSSKHGVTDLACEGWDWYRAESPISSAYERRELIEKRQAVGESLSGFDIELRGIDGADDFARACAS